MSSQRLDRGRVVPRGRKPKADPRVRKRADDLVASGMPYQMAMAVAHGRMELNEALERMARKDRVTILMERHELSRALATQIAIGHADLDQVLSRRRLEEHREAHRERSCLLPDASIALVTADGNTVKGVVKAVEPYQVQVDVGGAEETIHKLQLLYGYPPLEWKAVKKGLKDKKAEKKAEKKKADPPPDELTEGTLPAARPQDRYSCSDRRLFGYLDRKVDLNVTVLNGDVLRGQVSWFGRYEFGLKLRTDVDLAVFRHALRDVSPAES